MSVIAIGPGLSLWAPPPLRGGAALASLYELRSSARRVQAARRIARCGMDAIVPRDQPIVAVEVREAADGTRAAWWRGVARCHRVACPVCAAARAKSRARRLARVVRAAGPDARWTMITLTIPHGVRDPLRETIDRLLSAWRRTRATRAVRDVWAARVSASIRAIEVTWGSEHGWHPHIHLLVRGELTANEQETLRRAWCARTGASSEHGCVVSRARTGSDASGAYLAKLGCELGGAGKDRPGSRSHWRVLRRAVETIDTPAGAVWRARWGEYTEAVRGRRLFELDERATQLAESCPDEPEDVVRSWRVSVWREELRGVARVERATGDPWTWFVLRATSWGDPEHGVRSVVDAAMAECADLDGPPIDVLSGAA